MFFRLSKRTSTGTLERAGLRRGSIAFFEKNAHIRTIINRPARYVKPERDRDFIEAEEVKYNIRENEAIDVTRTFPLGVQQHYECFCPDLSGRQYVPIFIPRDQLREPSAEELEDDTNADFFAESVDYASSYRPSVASPERRYVYDPTSPTSTVFADYDANLAEEDYAIPFELTEG